MSFRKRSVVLSADTTTTNPTAATPAATNINTPTATPPKGTRPSFLTGVSTTSTGTASLDALLSGHAGQPLGSLLLIEESSTTDFAGALLRYYAAEGVVQGQRVVAVGVPESWGRELPGLSERREDNSDSTGGGKGKSAERMKIAWRYEVMGNRRAPLASSEPADAAAASTTPTDIFCHTYDLTKRLAIPPSSKPPIYIPPPPPQHATNPHPFQPLLARLTTLLSSAYDDDTADDSSTITRIVIPNLLSPLLYPPAATHPTNVLSFLHALRALTRRYSARVAVMISLSTGVYPRSTGLVRQIEALSDGVIELHPVPAFAERAEMRRGASASGTNTSGGDEVPQGLVRVWKAVEGKRGTGIAVGGEGGGGIAGMEGGDDLAFMLTRRRMRIERFSLPVDDGDEEEEKPTKVDLEF
ncbi:hypothetical protein TWF696_001518 [Orbilia brochopaga]|uniref:Elongator complex protein 4 n=1 Tax=Orbilia brochopaga TaxID=3140254 RepID=A0AAV9UD67_9PEZI